MSKTRPGRAGSVPRPTQAFSNVVAVKILGQRASADTVAKEVVYARQLLGIYNVPIDLVGGDTGLL